MVMLALLVGLAVSAVMLLSYYQPVLVKGYVDHKAAVGVRGGVAKTLVLVGPHGAIIKDEKLRLLVLEEGLSLTRALEVIKQEYEHIYYTVSIRVLTRDPVNHVGPGEALAYIADVDEFNYLEPGMGVAFEVSRVAPLEIIRVVKVVEP